MSTKTYNASVSGDSERFMTRVSTPRRAAAISSFAVAIEAARVRSAQAQYREAGLQAQRRRAERVNR